MYNYASLLFCFFPVSAMKDAVFCNGYNIFLETGQTLEAPLARFQNDNYISFVKPLIMICYFGRGSWDRPNSWWLNWQIPCNLTYPWRQSVALRDNLMIFESYLTCLAFVVLFCTICPLFFFKVAHFLSMKNTHKVIYLMYLCHSASKAGYSALYAYPLS